MAGFRAALLMCVAVLAASPLAAERALAGTAVSKSLPPCSAATAEEPKKKKKGLGFGGILSAAKQAGVGRLLGNSAAASPTLKGQVGGAVAATAIEAAGRASATDGVRQPAETASVTCLPEGREVEF